MSHIQLCFLVALLRWKELRLYNPKPHYWKKTTVYVMPTAYVKTIDCLLVIS